MSRLLAAAALAALAALAAGCGADAEPGAAAAATASRQPAALAQPTVQPRERERTVRKAAAGTRLRVIRSDFGRIVGDGPGLAVYIFDKERRGRSECYGACAEAWPPVLAKGRPVAGAGIRPELLGITRRRSGRRQLTYRDRPLYYYEHDRPGVVLCHDVVEFGGRWLVIRPDGRPAPSV